MFTDLHWKYIAIVDSGITYFELEKGNKLSVTTSEMTIDPLVTDSDIFAFKDMEITCLDKKNGKQIWSYDAKNL